MVALTTTISTPTNFVEYAKSIDENDPTRTFVENMLETSDVMRAIPILPAERGKRAYMDIATLPTGGAALSLANLDQLYWRVNKPTHWIMPRGLMPQWDTAARNNTLVNQTVGYSEDDVGRRIIKFKGLPILFGYEPDDSPDLLPFTEVASGGGAAQCASIYCVSFRPGGFYAIEQTALQVMAEGPVPGMPFDSKDIKADYVFAREHQKAVARLTSVNNLAPIAAQGTGKCRAVRTRGGLSWR